MIDRTRLLKPTESAAGYQRWRNLSFLHWKVPAELLRPWIPESLSIDTWEGDAWLGMVPFEMEGIRPWWSPALPYLCAFPETNLRTYVHYRGSDPGVWFFSLEASRLLAVLVARWGWRLNYRWAKMRVVIDGERLHYKSQRIGEAETRVEVLATLDSAAAPTPAAPNSLEYFLCERYLLYTVGFRGKLFRGQVYHEPYPLQSTQVEKCDQRLTDQIGLKNLENPVHALFSPGVDVTVFGLKTVES